MVSAYHFNKNGGTESQVFLQVTMHWLTFLRVGVLWPLFACERSWGAQCHTFTHQQCFCLIYSKYDTLYLWRNIVTIITVSSNFFSGFLQTLKTNSNMHSENGSSRVFQKRLISLHQTTWHLDNTVRKMKDLLPLQRIEPIILCRPGRNPVIVPADLIEFSKGGYT